MKKFMFSLSKAEVSTIIAILWTLACIIVFCGWAPQINEAVIEKMYSIEVMVVGAYFAIRQQKSD